MGDRQQGRRLRGPHHDCHPPPWIVHLRLGNLRVAEFRAFLARTWPMVEALLPAHKLINVYLDRLEAVADGSGTNGNGPLPVTQR